jgi:hypothetical protein
MGIFRAGEPVQIDSAVRKQLAAGLEEAISK